MSVGPLLVYIDRMRLFGLNARLYLLYTAVNGIAAGVYGLLFNFYVLQLGLDQALLGQLLSLNNVAALVAALPAGYLSDLLGRKRALLLAGPGSIVAVSVMVLWPSVTLLLAMVVLLGAFQTLGSVTMAPFIMENSGKQEQTYLFSACFAVQMGAVTLGYWLGGQLPSLMGNTSGVETGSGGGYGWSLLISAGLTLVALAPLLFLRSAAREKRADHLAPLRYALSHRGLLGKLVSPLIVTTMGAGLFVPFMNVFFRERFQSSDSFIGALFAAGSLAMALGLLLAPPLADRFGAIKALIVSQALSIPFLVLLGYAPWLWLSAGAYLMRVVLMNMNLPVYQAFAMNQVDEDGRGMAAAIINIGYSFGYALSPALSGQMQVQSGFAPVFAMAIVAYVVALGLYWRFFWTKETRDVPPVGLSV